MTRVTTARTSLESTQQEAEHTKTKEWLEFSDAEDCRYPHWSLHENALQAQIEDLDLHQAQSVTSQIFQTRDNPYFSTNDQAETTRTQPVPTLVFCSIVVSIRKCEDQNGPSPKTKFLYPDPQQIRWQDPKEYNRLRNIMDNFVQRQKPVGKREYLSTSRVRLLEKAQRGFEEVDSCTVETMRQWDRFLPRMIARFCGPEKMTPFFIELDADYEWFSIVGDPEFQDGEKYLKAVQNTLTLTALKNFEDKEYWSKKMLKRLFDERTVGKLVEEYVEKMARPMDATQQPVHISDAERDEFAEWLCMDRIRLLAATIRINADIDCLYKLMKLCTKEHAMEIEDSQIPLSQDRYKLFLDSHHHTVFRYTQAGFRPVDFPQPMNVMSVQENDLIPILIDRTKSLGKGGSGEVWRATIHSDYHAFSSNKNKVFALKISRPVDVEEGKKEVETWRRFARIPHQHINTLHTCWIQNHNFYMLSPLAKSNLEEYLNENDSPNLLHAAGWLLEQLEGIASAIQHIHYVGRAGYVSSRTTDDKIDNGYHHDLKPANILIFGHGHWKITDFGTARVRQVQSSSPQTRPFYTHNFSRGDEVYGGPDLYTVDQGSPRVGGAYDIWSFGCIILEVLLWSLGKTGKDLAEFRQNRANDSLDACRCQPKKRSKKSRRRSSSDPDSDDEPRIEMPNFWYRCKKANQFHLKPSVQNNLKWVKEQMRPGRPHHILDPLHNLVKSMLNVYPEERPAASVILSKLGILRVQAGAYYAKQRKKQGIDDDGADDFETMSNWDSYARSSRMGSPPLTDGGTMEHGSSGLPSQQNSLKRRRSSSAHSHVSTTLMPPEANDVSYAGIGLNDEAPLPQDTALLDCSGELEPSVKKQRSDSQMDLKIDVQDIDADVRLPVSSTTPELNNNRNQNLVGTLSPGWKRGCRTRLNQRRPISLTNEPDDPTWVEKQISSSSRS